MSVLNIENLLQPVSAQAPCGADLEYEPMFLELQELARGKPEQVIGDKVKPAQEPVWSNVRNAAEQLFSSTKDLRIAGILYISLLKTGGIAGLESGLALLRGLLERYWEHLYPLLDAEEDGGPTFRVNSLVAALVSEDAINSVRNMTLVESRQFGRHSLRNYRIAAGVLKLVSAEEQALEPAQLLARIDAAFADAAIEVLSTTAALLNACVEHFDALQQIMLEKADGIPDDIKSLAADLREMKALLDGQLAKRGVAIAVKSAPLDTGEASLDAHTPSLNGSIRNRTDVLAAIDKICAYYVRAEPSSPVPLLLQRAARLVNKDFMEILRDLAPAGVNEAELIGGLEKRDS